MRNSRAKRNKQHSSKTVLPTPCQAATPQKTNRFVLQMQQTLGNQAVQRLIQRRERIASPGNSLAEGAAIRQVGRSVHMVFRQAITDPLGYARSLETRYPGWRDVLPDCPCTNEEARSDTTTWEGGIGGCPDFFHPGAVTGYRSARGYSSVRGTSHGQQCCYDGNGNLITHGPGAGTPDVWSPTTNFFKHQLYDVQTWLRLGSRTYNRFWIPNRGSGCPPNRVERQSARCEPRYLGGGATLGEDCIIRQGPGPKL